MNRIDRCFTQEQRSFFGCDAEKIVVAEKQYMFT